MPQSPTVELGSAKTILLAALAAFAVFYVVVLVSTLLKRRAAGYAGPGQGDEPKPTPAGLVTGFVTNFFDTLGIGSYATTTAIFRFSKMVPDEQIPGTLNVGHTLPTIVQAFIFTQIVAVDSLTLILMIAAAVAGAWLGAGVVASWPRRTIQLGMGLALSGFALLMLVNLLGLAPIGGTAIGLSGEKLAMAIVVNFALGALMTLGIGLYAPCMILISLMGMDPKAAFPIMMGSCAFLMPVASARFVRVGAFNARAVIGLMVGGLPAVLIAALIVKALPLTAVQWLVVVVVVYTSATLLRSARRNTA